MDRQHQPRCLFDSLLRLGHPSEGLWTLFPAEKGCLARGMLSVQVGMRSRLHQVLVGSVLIQQLPSAGAGVGSLVWDSKQGIV